METLSGSGAQTTPTPTTHSVSLSWDPSTSTVVGYNVYRGTQTGGPYARVNGSVQAGTAYSDNNVQSGTTYFYVVTAVDASSQESGFSNETMALIPAP
jgi:fibronectin type 3 domain-containing protein